MARSDQKTTVELLDSEALGVFEGSDDIHIRALSEPLARGVALSGGRLAEDWAPKFLGIATRHAGLRGENWQAILTDLVRGRSEDVARWLQPLAATEVPRGLLEGLLEYICSGGTVPGLTWPPLLEQLLAAQPPDTLAEVGPLICLTWRVLVEPEAKRRG